MEQRTSITLATIDQTLRAWWEAGHSRNEPLPVPLRAWLQVLRCDASALEFRLTQAGSQEISYQGQRLVNGATQR